MREKVNSRINIHFIYYYYYIFFCTSYHYVIIFSFVRRKQHYIMENIKANLIKLFPRELK